MSKQGLDLSKVDVREFLEGLGVQKVTDDGVEARYSCPYPAHGLGDQTPSAYMNLESTAFMCHSCGQTGNAISFLADMKEVNRLTAKNWIAQKWDPRYAQIDDLRSFVERMWADKEELEAEFIPLPESTVSEDGAIKPGHWNLPIRPAEEYFLQRGLFPEVLEKFEFAYDSIQDRPCITVRTAGGGLVGFKGRAYREDQIQKYMVAGDTPKSLDQFGVRYGFTPYDASSHVYAAHLFEPVDDLLICREGELNVVAMHQEGFPNTVGPSGSTLKDIQVFEMARMAGKVLIFFDQDLGTPDSEMTARIKVLKAINAFEPLADVLVVNEPHYADPMEMDRDEIKKLVDGAVSSFRYKFDMRLHHVG